MVFMDRKSILDGYEKVNENILNLLTQQSHNLKVIRPHYIQPSLAATRTSLDDLHGEYLYFAEIRRAREKALSTGKIIRTELPNHAPKYLEEIAE